MEEFTWTKDIKERDHRYILYLQDFNISKIFTAFNYLQCIYGEIHAYSIYQIVLSRNLLILQIGKVGLNFEIYGLFVNIFCAKKLRKKPKSIYFKDAIRYSKVFKIKHRFIDERMKSSIAYSLFYIYLFSNI